MAAKIATSVEQSKKLVELGLDLNTSDMYYEPTLGFRTEPSEIKVGNVKHAHPRSVPCWSLNALIELLPEIKGTPLSILKSKIEDKNYYNLEYEGIIMLPYCKSLVDGCVEMIIKLKELNLL